jgi:hypothetical protein
VRRRVKPAPADMRNVAGVRRAFSTSAGIRRADHLEHALPLAWRSGQVSALVTRARGSILTRGTARGAAQGERGRL